MLSQLRRLFAILSLFGMFVLAGSSVSQAPKDKPAPRPKFNAKQIAEAEAKLVQASCAIHHEEIPPLVPNGLPQKGQVDIVAFPVDVTDADLAKLVPLAARLPNLKTIDLGQAIKVTSKGLKEVAKLSDLKAIFLDGCEVDADGLKELVVLKDLQWLDLSGSTVRDDDLKVLSDYPALQNLTMLEVPALSVKGVAHLQKLVRLRVLHISVDDDPKAMMTEVGKLDQLVELRAYPVGDVEVPSVGNLVRLQVLDLNNSQAHWRAWRGKAERGGDKRGADREAMKPAAKDPALLKKIADRAARRAAYTGITGEGFPHILKCVDLRVLKLAGHPIDVNGSGLDKLEFLQELDLSGTDFTDAGVSWLGRLKTLKKLWLSGTDITNEGVKGLAVAGGLEFVALDYLPLTDETIEHLARNRKLKELSLNHTRVACADKKAWAGFGRLERVYLKSTNISDSTLMNLAPLKTLKLVDARWNCPNVSLAGAAALQRDLYPGAQVWADSCQVGYWIGGGGFPVAKGTRQPDLDYRNLPSRPSASLTPNPPKTAPKAPSPSIRVAPLPGSGKP
jgi:Leucine-rich repeat (LRR) protein